MMFTKSQIFASFSCLFVLCAFFSCEKSPTSIQGNIDITVQVHHHGIPVDNATVYMIKDATDFPGKNPNLYPSFKVVDTNGEAGFINLFAGQYYLYAAGHDGVDSVWGNQPLFLDANMINGSWDIPMAVTE